MRLYPVVALTLLAGLVPIDRARAGVCDALHAKVCAGAPDADACARFVGEHLRGDAGERLSGLQRLMACRLVLDDRNTLADLAARAVRLGDPAVTLIGRWGLDVHQTMATDPKMSALSDDEKREAAARAEEMLGEMWFEFTESGEATTAMGDRVERSGYAIIGRDGNRLTVITVEESGETVVTERMTFIVEAQRLVVSKGEQTIVLRRRAR